MMGSWNGAQWAFAMKAMMFDDSYFHLSGFFN
jgi:hypothetical protein